MHLAAACDHQAHESRHQTGPDQLQLQSKASFQQAWALQTLKWNPNLQFCTCGHTLLVKNLSLHRAQLFAFLRCFLSNGAEETTDLHPTFGKITIHREKTHLLDIQEPGAAAQESAACGDQRQAQ